MLRKTLFALAIMLAGICQGQTIEQLTLADCYDLALQSYPLADRSALLDEASEIRQKRLNTNYLPQVQINGQASYQSDVTSIDVEIPPFYIPPPIDLQVTPTPLNTPVPPKDQYKFTMDLQQVIYDGGITGKQKKVEELTYDLEKQKVEVELHKLKENINMVFFSIILLQENDKLLNVLMEELELKLRDVDAAVKHGVALSSDRDVLKAEVIRVEQKKLEVSIQKRAFIEILGELLSSELSEDIVLEMPGQAIPSAAVEPLRPELRLFEMQRSLLESNKDLISSTWMPRLAGFGQLGYGNPGLNFLEDEWTPYYIFGAKLSWNLWNWNQNKKDKQVLGIQQGMVEKERETFDKNLDISLTQYRADVEKYERLMEKDQEVILLRESIAKTASSQLDNGVITSSDYVSRLNEKTQAKLDLEVHRVKLARARVDYLTSLGIL